MFYVNKSTLQLSSVKAISDLNMFASYLATQIDHVHQQKSEKL